MLLHVFEGHGERRHRGTLVTQVRPKRAKTRKSVYCAKCTRQNIMSFMATFSSPNLCRSCGHPISVNALRCRRCAHRHGSMRFLPPTSTQLDLEAPFNAHVAGRTHFERSERVTGVDLAVVVPPSRRFAHAGSVTIELTDLTQAIEALRESGSIGLALDIRSKSPERHREVV